MNARQSTLLKCLLDVDHFTPIEEFTQPLSCSEKTVRSCIPAVNSFLQANGFAARVETKRGSGIRMHADKSEKNKLEAILEKSTLSIQPRLDHFYQGILLLTCAKERYTTDQLARALYTNKQQLRADLLSWQRVLEPFHLALEKGRTLSIEGDERAVRFFIIYYLYLLAPQAMKSAIEPSFLGSDLDFIQSVETIIESGMGISISNNARKQLATYIKVMVSRIARGQMVPTRKDSNVELAPYLEKARAILEQHFPVHISINEMHLVDDLFQSCTWQWSNDLIQAFEPSDEAAGLERELSNALFNRFGAPMPASLEKPMAILLQNALIRAKRSISIPGPNERLAKFDHLDSYLLLAQVFEESQMLSDAHLYGSDFTRITLVLLEYFQQANLQRRYRAALLVDTGIDQIVYATNRIERLAPMVRIAGVVSEDEVKKADKDGAHAFRAKYDFLITMGPVETSFPSIAISYAVDDQDISNIIAAASYLDGDIAPKKLVLEESALQDMEFGNEDMAQAVFDRLCASDAIDLPFERFSRIFSANVLFRAENAICAIFDRGVNTTCSTLYTTTHDFFVDGRRVSCLAILLVAEEDRDILMSLVEQFKQLVSARIDLDTELREFFV